MGFGDLKSESGIKALNEYLAKRSYIEGYALFFFLSFENAHVSYSNDFFLLIYFLID